MNKTLSLTLLAGGIFLTVLGFIAYNSTNSDISRMLTGTATDESFLLLFSGIVLTITALVGLLLPKKSSKTNASKRGRALYSIVPGIQSEKQDHSRFF